MSEEPSPSSAPITGVLRSRLPRSRVPTPQVTTTFLGFTLVALSCPRLNHDRTRRTPLPASPSDLSFRPLPGGTHNGSLGTKDGVSRPRYPGNPLVTRPPVFL